jgi:hypothetical protein
MACEVTPAALAEYVDVATVAIMRRMPGAKRRDVATLYAEVARLLMYVARAEEQGGLHGVLPGGQSAEFYDTAGAIADELLTEAATRFECALPMAYIAAMRIVRRMER